MSISFCRVCHSSKNVSECCGLPTDMDEFYRRELVLVPGEISLEEADAKREANLAMVLPLSDFEKADILKESIESLGWDAFSLDRAGEKERAMNLRTVIKQKESELKALHLERTFG